MIWCSPIYARILNTNFLEATNHGIMNSHVQHSLLSEELVTLLSEQATASCLMFRVVFWVIPDDGGSTHLWNVCRQSFYTAV
jgi:hypothetical protein